MLQIRRIDIDSFNVTVMTQLEQRPTGSLNVFEYELLSVDIQPGDLVRIQNIESEHGKR